MTDKPDERKALAELVVAYIEDRQNGGHDGNAPGHAHDVPGVWDADNVPGKRGTKCRWCAAWFAARAVLATAPAEPPKDGEIAAMIERIDAMLIAERAIVVAHNSDDAGIDDIGQITKQHSHALSQCWRKLKKALITDKETK